MPRPDIQLGGKAVQLAAAGSHNCALLDTGVLSWGYNEVGQLGYGNTSNIGNSDGEMPAADVQVGGKIVKIAAAGWQTCALLDSGALRCWVDEAGGRAADPDGRRAPGPGAHEESVTSGDTNHPTAIDELEDVGHQDFAIDLLFFHRKLHGSTPSSRRTTPAAIPVVHRVSRLPVSPPFARAAS